VEKIPTWQVVVAGALQRADGCWLMHKRPANKHHGGLWEFPGGKVEIGENPPFSLSRELNEELGILVNPDEVQPITFAHEPAESSSVPIVILLYIVREWQGPIALQEGGEIGWFKPGELAQLPKPPLDSDLAACLFPSDCA
jgi:8-oxo-dGTP diphosphatase